MIYAVSGNTQITVPANKVLKVTSPAPKVGYPGYVVLISNVSGVAAPEVQQNPPTPVAVGTDYTEPTTGFINTISQANLFGANPWGAVTRVNGHGPGVQQFFYPYFDASMQGALTGDCGLVLALNSFGDPGGLGPDWFAAREQNSDGHLPLSNNSGGNFTITPPAVNTSTSGGNGGGGFRT